MSGHRPGGHQASYPSRSSAGGGSDSRAFEPAFPKATAVQQLSPDSSMALAIRDRFHAAEATQSLGDPRGFHGDDHFAARQLWADPSTSSSSFFHQQHQGHYVERPTHSAHHPRPQHHPYAHFEHSAIAHTHQPSSHPLSSQPFHAHPSSSAMPSALLADADPQGTRQVSRAACLSCRSAKRKCDGVKPVCGPCAQRGVQDDVVHPDGACVYVASKRGGPRFKGIRGSEATKKVLSKRERLRIEEEERAARASFSPDAAAAAAAATAITTAAADRGLFSPDAAQAGIAPYAAAAGAGTESTPRRTLSRSLVHDTPDRQVSPASGMPSVDSRLASDTTGPVSPQTPQTPSSIRFDAGQDGSADAAQSPGVFAFGHQRDALCQGNYFCEPAGGVGGLFSDLSLANLEIWQQSLQGEQASPADTFANFYRKLENLPKAGVLNATGIFVEPPIDDFDVQFANVDVSEAAKLAAAVNSEQQTRALLSDYYKLVYPGCPVMLPSDHLSSLAFHLSEDDSSALLAAVSSCVALQLPQAEVHRIVRGSMHLADPDDKEVNAGLWALENSPREEIALFHAKSAERLLYKKVAQLARGGEKKTLGGGGGSLSSSGSSSSVGDLELVRIKLVATHVLLSHYYYGVTEQKRAFHHATQAWTYCQALGLDVTSNAPTTPSWFSSTQKNEWARRAYWASYTAATVMSCTGGFAPLSVTRNSPADLRLLPGAGQELACWKVLVKGGQFVSRAYATLYDLEAYRNDPVSLVAPGQPQPRQHQQKWEGIFSRMQSVDNDVMNYTRHDPAWSDTSCFDAVMAASQGHGLSDDENDLRLKRSLRNAGKLMTSGALIILHRTQAFANASIFVSPTCGLPGIYDDDEDRGGNCGEGESGNGSSVDSAYDPIASRLERGQGSQGVGGNRSSSARAAPQEVAPDKRNDAASARKHAQQPTTGETESDRAAKRARTRPVRRLSNTSRSSSSSDSGGGASTSDSATTPSISAKRVDLTPHGIPVAFAGGPFDPAISLERCRFAASVMYTALPDICSSTFRHGRRVSTGPLATEGLNLDLPQSVSREEWSAPTLPPYSACSLVLAAYVLLMETLHAQLSAGGSGLLDARLLEESKTLEAPFLLNADPDRPRQIPQVKGRESLQLAVRLRRSIAEIEHALQKFARAWDVAKNYVQEVKILLEVNGCLFPTQT